MAIEAGLLLGRRYRADELLGRGGMGEVWRCRDIEQGRDVAVKAVRPELLRDSFASRLFHSEVVAVARLNHSSIVPVYDLIPHGDGTTLLVMEYRQGSSLASFIRARPAWPFIRDVLIQVLEALACAHSRGVLHLDIKPENVVVELDGASGIPGKRPGTTSRPAAATGVTERPSALALGASGFNIPLHVTLLDFGIARIRRPGKGVERWLEGNVLVGTLEYMAPEQCTGSFERIGPWTDLYSVGAMAYELCAGKRPFPDAHPLHAVVMRTTTAAPALVPRTNDVPRAFVDLCAQLLATEPRDRPFNAADVLDALREMSAGGSHAIPEIDLHPELVPTTAVTRHVLETLVAESQPTSSDRHMFSGPVRPLVTAHPSRAILDEGAIAADVAVPPAGAYGLFGLRDLPVLGRSAERRAMWGAVRAAVVERRTHTVLLEGPAGAGKSRLARDVMERSVELGVCFAMQTSWSPEGSGDEGLRGLVENLLDTRGASAHDLRARLDFWLQRIPGAHAPFAREVELLLRPPREAAPDAELPLRVAVEAIALATELRPVLLWLDDIQWSRGEAVALVRALRAHKPPIAVCAIATAREEEMVDRSALDALLGEPPAEGPSSSIGPPIAHVARVRVDPLDLDATRALVRGLLDVDDDLCDALAARAEGNPLFVTQLLSQLVSADAVERVDGRYRLARGVDPTSVPADMGAVWARRVAQSGAAEKALGALALVRGRVSLEVAHELGGFASVSDPRSLAEPSGSAAETQVDLDASIQCALSAGLLRIEGGAYVWAHGLLRDYLIDSLDPEVAPALHAAAADALARLVGREDVQEERARHLVRAEGRTREACEAMLDAGLWSFRRADAAQRRSRFETLANWSRAAGYADLEARALAELGYFHAELGESDPAVSLITTARGLLGLGDPATEPETLESLRAAAWVAFRHAQVARLGGRGDEGARATQEAEWRARASGDLEVETLALLQQGVDAARAGDNDRGRDILQHAAEIARRAGDRVGEAHALRTLSHIERSEQALALVERSIDLARTAGALRVELVCKQVWVHLLWGSGARDVARREARALAAEAARRSLRQTVSILELQSAGWAATEERWDLVREHRNAASRWGARAGATAERVTLLALDLLLAIVARDAAEAEALAHELVQTRGGYDDPALRDLLARARALAPPNVAAVLDPPAPITPPGA